MRRRRPTRDDGTLAVDLASDVAVAQTTVEQTIQIDRRRRRRLDSAAGHDGRAAHSSRPAPGASAAACSRATVAGRSGARRSASPARTSRRRRRSPTPKGRFEFRDLPAGRFTLQATKSGFVNVQYGQTRPFESGKPIELADKQSLDNADISMPRGSVIAGRIVDEFGDAMPDVSVTAMRQTWQNGRRRLVPSPGRIAQTNDLGQFRIYGLPPGEYYVSASLRSGGDSR